jgi:hypothetical protein
MDLESGSMLMAPVEAASHWRDFIVVRLLRRWYAEGATGNNKLHSLVSLACELGVQAQAAVAVASLLQLTEACLGRPLEAECCCSPKLSRDERAVLILLDNAPSLGPGKASHAIPHGLPAALLWAAASVRQLLPGRNGPPTAMSRCPFSPEPLNVA